MVLRASMGASSAAAAVVSNQSSGVPMTGIDKATGRVVALVVLLVVAAVALRGYLPGAERAAPREQPTNGAASLLAVVALVTVSLVVIAIAIIARLRDRRVPLPARAVACPSRLVVAGATDVALLADRARRDHRLAADRPTAGHGSAHRRGYRSAAPDRDRAPPRSDGTANQPPPSAPPEDARVFRYLAATR